MAVHVSIYDERKGSSKEILGAVDFTSFESLFWYHIAWSEMDVHGWKRGIKCDPFTF